MGAPWNPEIPSLETTIFRGELLVSGSVPLYPHQTQGMNKGVLGIRLSEPVLPLVRLAIKPPAIGGVTSSVFF